jgi:hypothetical protein
MGENNSIINFGELSKPATVLIEKVSDAVGGCFKPYQIKRVAKAEAEAEIIRAQAQIEITDLQRRALTRFIIEEAKKQGNIEAITEKAIPLLEDKSKPQEMENDWVTNFFDKCRLISDADMQQLWARVLAGEANAPNSYSKRTVNFLSSLDKLDADVFTNLCTFQWLIGDEIVPIIVDHENAIYAKHGIFFSSLTHLDSIGLIQFSSLGGYACGKLPKTMPVFYYNEKTDLEFLNESDNKIEIGTVILTKIGKELAPICGSEPDMDFMNYIIEEWTKQGYIKKPAGQDASPEAQSAPKS